MRALEFICEGPEKKLRKASRYALPHVKQYDIDQYYEYYRLGIAMAGSPDDDSPIAGPAKDKPSVYPYSEADEEIVTKAVKNQGIKGKTLVQKGPSQELPDTNIVSPISNWMNKNE